MDGQINGQARSLLVDTGASLVAMSSRQAASLGISLENAQRGIAHTAQGATPFFKIKIDSIDVGGISIAGRGSGRHRLGTIHDTYCWVCRS